MIVFENYWVTPMTTFFPFISLILIVFIIFIYWKQEMYSVL